MKELSEKAAVAEVGQHVTVAKEILGNDDGAQVVAFLLKSYFNERAKEARGVEQADEGKGRETHGRREHSDARPRQDDSQRRNQRRRPRTRRPAAGYGSQQDGPQQQNASTAGQAEQESSDVAPAEGYVAIRVNIGFEDGFKGRGAVAKKIAALAGLNDSSLREVESRRQYAVVTAKAEIADLLLERVHGAAIGKKVLNLNIKAYETSKES